MRRAKCGLLLAPLVGVLLTPLAVGGQAAADEAAIQQLVQRYFAAFDRKDLDAVVACWSAKSPQLGEVKQSAQNRSATLEDQHRVHVQFTRWQIAMGKARVRLRYDLKARDAHTKKPVRATFVSNGVFVKEPDGWKFWQLSEALGDLARALLRAQTKAERAQLLQDDPETIPDLVNTLNDSADRLAKGGQFAQASQLCELAFEAAGTLGDKEGPVVLAKCHWQRGVVAALQSQHAAARADFRRALALFREAKDRQGEAATLINLGATCLEQGQYQEAFGQFEAGLELGRATNDPLVQLGALRGLGNVHIQQAEYPEALRKFAEGLRLAQARHDPEMAAALLSDQGAVYRLMGRYGDALAALQASLQTSLTAKTDRHREAATRINLGSVYAMLGRYAEALDAYGAALVLAVGIRDGRNQMQALIGIGNVHALTDQHQASFLAYQKGLKFAAALPDPHAEALVRSNLGILYTRAGLHAQAVEEFEASLRLRRRIGDQQGEALALINLGNVYGQAERPAADKEVAQYEAALAIAERIGDQDTAFRAHYNLGVGHRKHKRWRLAMERYRQASQCIEFLRGQTREPSLQIGFFESYTAPYHGLAECWVELQQPPEAFAVSEQAKARTLVDLLQGGKVHIVKALTGAERRTEQELDRQLTALALHLTTLRARPGADGRDIQALQHQLDQARTTYAEFRRRLYFAHPELQTLRAQFAPVTLTQLNQTLFARDPNLCLLSYLVDSEETLLFVVRRGPDAHGPATLAVHRRPVPRDELRQEVEDFRRWCQKPEAAHRYETRQLYDWLVAPAAQELAGTTHLVLVPDGVLHTLPFHALRDPQGRHLVDTHAVSYAPSVTALVEMVAKAEQRRQALAAAPRPGEARPALLAVGRPTLAAGLKLKDLPASEAEAKAIAGLFGQQAFLGAQADKATVQAALAQARYVHLATHGLLNEAAGMYSAIALAERPGRDDGLLHARELLDLDLQAELVVLSACQTALGQRVSGEGILGLTWALFVAGAPSSVVSLWLVDDDSTRALMTDFYRRLTAAGEAQAAASKAEALRQAQLRLLKGKDGLYQHPFYWAPFVLVGDWRQ
jgi:CHAT domain-containing protein/tetratricopeptide (TPR) repeat protein